MYRTKPLVPFWDDDQIHLRGKGDSNRDDAAEFIEEFNPKWASESEAMGFSKLPALCGEMVPSKQNVLARFDREEVCDDCLEVANEKGIDISTYTNE